jgi:HK97 family phage portal protein
MGLRELASRAVYGEQRTWNPKLGDMMRGRGYEPRSSRAVTVNAVSALQHSAVFACRNLLVRDVSTLPVDVFAGRAEVPPPTIVADPSPEPGVSAEAWLAQVVDSAVMRGNVFGLVTSVTSSGHAERTAIINPDEVDYNPKRGWRVAGEPVELYELGGSLWHVPLFPPAGSRFGLSVLEHARQMIGLGLAAQGFGREFFEAPQPTGLLSLDFDNVTDEQSKTVKRRFKESVEQRDVVVLAKAAKYQPLSISPEESQFLQTIAANDGQIARFFGVPAAKIGASTKAGSGGGDVQYSNIEQQQLAYYVDAVRPLLVAIERAWSRLLPPGQRVQFVPDAILRVDTTTRYNAHASALGAGWMTVNEVRELEDLPPLGAGGMGVAELTRALQQIYLSAGSVITSDEAREILNRAGAGLALPGNITSGGGAA